MTSRATLANRVRKGADWLDVNQPGWEKRITLPELDLASCTKCVFGQVFADQGADYFDTGFDVGEKKLRATGARTSHGLTPAVRLGFDRDGAGFEEDYETLQDLWRVQIEKRLGSQAA